MFCLLQVHTQRRDGLHEQSWGQELTVKESWAGRPHPVVDRCFGGLRSIDAVDMITFDFEQNLPIPNLHHNDVFYARQMWEYNFGVHDCVADYTYMWDEATAKRGSSCPYPSQRHIPIYPIYRSTPPPPPPPPGA